MLRGDVGLLLQVKGHGEVEAESLHCLIVASSGVKASLPVMPRQPVELIDEGKINIMR